MDAYYRDSPALVVIGDKDAIRKARPLKYIEHENEVEQTEKQGGAIFDERKNQEAL